MEMWQIDGFIYTLHDTDLTRVTIYQILDDATRFDVDAVLRWRLVGIGCGCCRSCAAIFFSRLQNSSIEGLFGANGSKSMILPVVAIARGKSYINSYNIRGVWMQCCVGVLLVSVADVVEAAPRYF